MTIQRIPTGIPGLDDVLDGGLPAGRTYLLIGGPGTGKTVLSLQWLLDGQSRCEQGLYLTLAESGAEIERNIASFGWNPQGLALVDLSPAAQDDAVPHDEYHVFSPSEVEREPVWQTIRQAVLEHQPRRLVLDSVTQLRFLSADEYQFRKNILWLIAFLNRQGCTALLMFEPAENERDSSVALAVDGIFRLRRERSASLAVALRSLEVEKLRGSDFRSGLHPIRITAQGIQLFPHRIEATGEPVVSLLQASSGIAALDELLGGGLELGTTTLITGPTGAGKSVMGTQFLAHMALTHKTALFSFEEASTFIAARCASIGHPIEALLASGMLSVTRINPLELYPDEFLARVRAAVEQNEVRMVMIDSLRGYQVAMEEFGTPQAHLHNLVAYLNRLGVTTLLINEARNIIGNDIRATDLGISHLADNLVLLRYAELDGQVIRVVGCLKKRLGMFQPELRQLSTTATGLQVGKKLSHLSGILSGLPMATVPATGPLYTRGL